MLRPSVSADPRCAQRCRLFQYRPNSAVTIARLAIAEVGLFVPKPTARAAKLGNPVATWRDGRVVWLQPAEILASLADEAPPPSNQ